MKLYELMDRDNDLQCPPTSQKERPVVGNLLMGQHHVPLKRCCSQHRTSRLTISLQEIPGTRTRFKNVTSMIHNMGYSRKNDLASVTNEVYKKIEKKRERELIDSKRLKRCSNQMLCEHLGEI